MAGSTAFFGQLLARYAGNTLAEQDAKAAQKKADRDMQLEMLLGRMNDPTLPLNSKNNAARVFMELSGMKEGSPEYQAVTQLSDKIKAKEPIGGMVIDQDGDGVPDLPSQGQPAPTDPYARGGDLPSASQQAPAQEQAVDPYARGGDLLPAQPSTPQAAQQFDPYARREELPVGPSLEQVPTGQAQPQVQEQAQLQAQAEAQTPGGIPPVPQAQPIPTRSEAFGTVGPSQEELRRAQPDLGLLATQQGYDEKSRLEANREAEAIRIKGVATLERQTAEIDALNALQRNKVEEDFVATVQSYRAITGEEPDKNTMLAMRGIAITGEKVTYATSLTQGEDLMGVKNPDGSPLTDTTGQPIKPGSYRLMHDENGVFKGAIRTVEKDEKQAKITITDVGGSKAIQVWNTDGTQRGETRYLQKSMTPAQAADFAGATLEVKEEILKDYSIALSSTGTFKWSDIPIELRRQVSKYALENGYVVLSPGEREDIAALDKSLVLMKNIWKELIGTRRKANGERYESVEDFMQTMDSYKADHNGNLPEGFGGVLQKAGGMWDVIKGVAGYDSGAYKVVSAISEQLSVLLARAFGDVGNIAVSEREAAKKAIAGFTDNDSAVYKLIGTFRRTVVDIRALVIEEANTVLRRKAFGTRKGEGAGTQGAQSARGGIEPVPGTAGAGVSQDKNLEIISRWKTQ